MLPPKPRPAARSWPRHRPALRRLRLALRLTQRALRRLLRPNWTDARVGLPPPGTSQGAASAGGWALAWSSRAGPHHLNQDCAGARWLTHDGSSTGLALAVADGVTHGAAGDVAALALVHHWLRGPTHGQSHDDFLRAAEPVVASALRQCTPEPGAATGAACWLHADGSGRATRVGDCRVMLARCVALFADSPAQWCIEPLLRDQAHAGFDDDDAGQPSRMVGCGSLGEPEAVPVHLCRSQLLLLTSDGLHSAVLPADWSRALHQHLGHPDEWPSISGETLVARLEALINDLIQTAALRGSEDDITLLIALRGHAAAIAQGGQSQ